MSFEIGAKRIWLYHAAVSIVLAVTCFFTYNFGVLKLDEYVSLPKDHILIVSLFFYYTFIFGIVAYSVSSGTNIKRIMYLFLGAFTFFICMAISLREGDNDPAKPGFGINFSLALSLLYFAGGLAALGMNMIVKFFNYLKSLTTT